MSEQFPRQVWKLTPGYQPKEITIIAVCRSYMYDGYRIEGTTALISKHDVWPTRAEAIAAGHARLDEQLAALDKKRANIDKRRAALTKAALADI